MKKPSILYFSVFFHHQIGEGMLIFGGEATDGNLQNTMWCFDLGEQSEIMIMKFDINIDL